MNYKVGDKVKIRSWKSMENEFGITSCDDICMKTIVFVPQMKCFCGKNASIARLIINRFGNAVYRIEGAGNWCFSEQTFDLRYRDGGENGGM